MPWLPVPRNSCGTTLSDEFFGWVVELKENCIGLSPSMLYCHPDTAFVRGTGFFTTGGSVDDIA